jgi:predicted nucleic acid-binding protein
LIVIDASTVLSWMLPDEVDEFARRSASDVLDQTAVVPPIFPSEVTNALVAAHRRGRIDRSIITDELGDLANLPIVVESAAMTITDEIELAIKHGLTIYDAMYLALARRQRVTLVTRDKRLADAARGERLDVRYAQPPAS